MKRNFIPNEIPEISPMTGHFVDWKKDNSKLRKRAQKQALRDLKWLLKHSDLRLGQIVANATRGRTSNTFYIQDETIATALAELRRQHR